VRENDLGLMQRAVLRSDGTATLLRWLARRLDARAVLLDPAGEPVQSFPDCPSEVLRYAASDIKRVITGEWAAASISGPAWWARLASVGGDSGGSALLVTACSPLTPDDGALLAHAAALLRLRWSADERDKADTHIREAVLHLLMAGQVGAARRVAGVMKPPLADVVRVYLVEGSLAARNAIAGLCGAACGGRAWIVRCPVYRRHVIILSPADDRPDPDDRIFGSLRSAVRVNVAIGAGEAVSLRDTATGYEQAYHALAVARHRPDRCARFTAASDLAAILGDAARPWAQRVLSPLLDYEPPRPQDPDSSELRATLRSWLDFHAAAWRQLKIHRNTLLERIRRVETILGRDLSRLPVQAELHLALRLANRPGGGDATTAGPGLDELLGGAAAGQWAEMMLAPLTGEAGQPLLDTVRAWLAADTRPEATAAMLGLSARGAHRRLTRAEERLGRSLLGGPSARYDLLLALRIRDALASRL
jgi:hypothetical protein